MCIYSTHYNGSPSSEIDSKCYYDIILKYSKYDITKKQDWTLICTQICIVHESSITILNLKYLFTAFFKDTCKVFTSRFPFYYLNAVCFIDVNLKAGQELI